MIPSVIPKSKQLREMISLGGYPCKIEVDGGINWENIEVLAKAGVDIVVAGTLIYQDPDPAVAVMRLKSIKV